MAPTMIATWTTVLSTGVEMTFRRHFHPKSRCRTVPSRGLCALSSHCIGGETILESNAPAHSAGTREDSNNDPTRTTVPYNPNATPTRDRPVTPEDDRANRLGAGFTPAVGPPNADEPPAVPQIGTPYVVGIRQPQEAKPVSAANAAPQPARFHGEPVETAYQSQPALHSRPQIHQSEQGAGITSTPIGGDAVTNADQAGVGREEVLADPSMTAAQNEAGDVGDAPDKAKDQGLYTPAESKRPKSAA